MQIRFFTAILFFALLSDSLWGQERGSFRIRDLTVRLSQTDSVEVMFSIELLSNSATRKGGLRLTPTIINSENEVRLASIYAEKQKSRSDKHEIVPDSVMVLMPGKSTNYSTSIPFQEWMNGAKLDLDMVRVSRKQSIILSKTLQNSLVLEKKRVVPVENRETIWQVTQKLEFIFSPKGISKEVVESLVSGKHALAIEALLKLEKSPQVWNILGVAYGYNGAYDKARHCFEMAQMGGLKMAAFNIDELNKKVIEKKI